MKKAKIYTKTGDKGETGLVSGSRIPKSDGRIDLYGELDELNSRIGFSCSNLALEIEFQHTIDFLHHVQSAIFDLGSNLACEVENRGKFNLFLGISFMSIFLTDLFIYGDNRHRLIGQMFIFPLFALFLQSILKHKFPRLSSKPISD
jgi:hypothetical protein